MISIILTLFVVLPAWSFFEWFGIAAGVLYDLFHILCHIYEELLDIFFCLVFFSDRVVWVFCIHYEVPTLNSSFSVLCFGCVVAKRPSGFVVHNHVYRKGVPIVILFVLRVEFSGPGEVHLYFVWVWI